MVRAGILLVAAALDAMLIAPALDPQPWELTACAVYQDSMQLWLAVRSMPWVSIGMIVAPLVFMVRLREQWKPLDSHDESKVE